MARGLTYRREIDRVIGAPLLFLAGIVFKKRTAPPALSPEFSSFKIPPLETRSYRRARWQKSETPTPTLILQC